MPKDNPQPGETWRTIARPQIPFVIASRHGGFEALRAGVRIRHGFVPRIGWVDLNRFLRDYEFVSGGKDE